MEKHFPTFKKHWDEHSHRLPESLFIPGAAVWIMIGALIGFFIAVGTMDTWVVSMFDNELTATMFVPALIIISAGSGMALGISLHRAWDHYQENQKSSDDESKND